jgi:hypothetical protein
MGSTIDIREVRGLQSRLDDIALTWYNRVAVLGDSAAAQNGMFQETWPTKLERLINQRGGNAVVRDFSVNGTTFYRMKNNLDFGTKTALQRVIDFRPNMVIVSSGQNDAVNAADGRTSVQQIADATAIFAALRAALPRVPLIYAAEIGFDVDNFPTPGVTLKNKGAFPANMTLPAAGILNGLWTTEMLETDIGATTRGRYANWVSLDTAIRALATVDGSLTLQYWKAARLGMLSSDNTHMTNAGQTFIACSAFKGLRALSPFTKMFPNLSDQIITGWQDPDALFTSYLADSGDGYALTFPGDQYTDAAITQAFGPNRSIFPDTWVYPTKARAYLNTLAPTLNPSHSGIFVVNIFNAKPYTLMEVSVAGGAFSATPNFTDANGFGQGYMDLIAFGLPAGTYDFRFKVGSESYGPFSVVIGAVGKITGSQGATLASAATIALGGNRNRITGTTNISRITSTGWTPGSRITLVFDGALTLVHGTAASGADYGLKLVGSANVAVTAGDNIQLELDADNSWNQVGQLVAI